MTERAPIIIAIDGPSASGKSTVARTAAKRLNWIYVDSGALYRGVTWKAVHDHVDVNSSNAVISMMEQATWEFFIRDHSLCFTVDGEEPGLQLRSEPVREKVSIVAAICQVRDFVTAQLRLAVRHGNLVIEGRDIGSVVFPDTPFKFYLDADPGERARRRALEIQQAEGQGDVEKVLNSLTRRDRIDSTRKTAPLQIPLGAHIINSTNLSVDEVVDGIIAELNKEGVVA